MQAADATGSGDDRPRLSRAQVLDLSVGLFGVQVVWGLQNVNTTRIFQTLGADVAQLPMLWIAAPITGLLVQPIVGHWSDRSSGRWGRRKPFILVGAALTALAMLAMSAAATLPAAVLALWLLTASVNIVMQPFRALGADLLPPDQRTAGFATQVFFIGAGAVLASALPWMLSNWFGVAGVAPTGALPPSVRLAFQVGAAALIATVGWTLLRTPDRPVAPPRPGAAGPADGEPVAAQSWSGPLWVWAGTVLAAAAWALGLRREVFLLAALGVAFGGLRVVGERRRQGGRALSGLLGIVDDVVRMPLALRRLAATQFLTWFGLFAMWVYAVPAVALRHYGGAVPGSTGYAASGDWVGVLFAIYDAAAAAAALALPWLMGRVGLRASHAACLAVGAAGLAGFLMIDDPRMLWVPAIAIGVAWASILSTPYVIVADAIPAAKVGVYMGIHNIFLVVPQLLGAAGLGAVLDRMLGGRSDAMLAVAAAAFALAALSCARLPVRTTTATSRTTC